MKLIINEHDYNCESCFFAYQTALRAWRKGQEDHPYCTYPGRLYVDERGGCSRYRSQAPPIPIIVSGMPDSTQQIGSSGHPPRGGGQEEIK